MLDFSSNRMADKAIATDSLTTVMRRKQSECRETAFYRHYEIQCGWLHFAPIEFSNLENWKHWKLGNSGLVLALNSDATQKKEAFCQVLCGTQAKIQWTPF